MKVLRNLLLLYFFFSFFLNFLLARSSLPSSHSSTSSTKRSLPSGYTNCKAPFPDTLVISYETLLSNGILSDATPITSTLTSLGINYDFVRSRTDQNGT